MRNWSEAVVFTGVVLSIVIPGGLVLRRNEGLRNLLSGPPRVIGKGVQIEPLAGYRWNSHEATLIMALRSDCPYCQASMGLYGRISNLWKDQMLNAYPLVLFPDSAKAAEPEIRDIQRLTNVDYLKLGIRGTPTVLLVDSRGKVLEKWAGQLPPSEEQGLLSTVRRLSARLP